MAQTRYGYSTPHGIPGGLVDLSDYVVDARCNEAESGKIKYGLGVVTGSNPGSNIDLPSSASKAADFEGIAFSKRSHEMNMNGSVEIGKNETVGVLRRGRVYVRVKDGIQPEYGQTLCLITDGDNAGYFTVEDDAEATSKFAVNARYLGAAANGIAPADIFGAAAGTTNKEVTNE